MHIPAILVFAPCFALWFGNPVWRFSMMLLVGVSFFSPIRARKIRSVRVICEDFMLSRKNAAETAVNAQRKEIPNPNPQPIEILCTQKIYSLFCYN